MTTPITSLEAWKNAGEWIVWSGQHRIFVSTCGQGPPLFLLHGFPSSSHDYSRIAPLLSQHFRLIMPDFLGFGLSDKPRTHTYSLFEQADIIEFIASSLRISSCWILTHDMANSVTLELLRRNRLQVEQIIMLNGSVWLEFYRPLLTQRLLLHPWIGPLLSKLRLIRKSAFTRQFNQLFVQPLTTEEIDLFWEFIQYNDGIGIYHRLIHYLRERKQHERTWLEALQSHPAKLTVVWGQQDPVSVPKIADVILQYRPDATYFPLANIGHYPQWETPEQIAQILQQLWNTPLHS